MTGHWDTMTIFKIIRGHTKKLASGLAPGDQAELDDVVEEALAIRHDAAHGGAIDPHSVVQSLSAMFKAMEVLGFAKGEEAGDLLAEARRVAAAPAGILEGSATKVAGHDFGIMVIDLVLRHWELRMRPLVRLKKWGSEPGEPLEAAEEKDAQSMLKMIKGDPRHKDVEKLRNKHSHNDIVKKSELAPYFEAIKGTLLKLEKEVLRLSRDNKARLGALGYSCVDDDDEWQRLEARCTHAQALQEGDDTHVELERQSTADGLGRARFLKMHMLVGRETDIERAALELLEGSGRCIIAGPPGVGKDVVARQVLLRPDVEATQLYPFMPRRLLGTSTDHLQGSLRRLAVDHLGAAADDQMDKVIGRVRSWLAAKSGWLLYVEDCAADAAALLRSLVPPPGRGRVLVTSNEKVLDLEAAGFVRHELGGFSMAEAMELLKVKMNLKDRIEHHDDGEHGPEDLTPALEGFIRDKLELLPLLVSFCGRFLRSMSVTKMVAEHAKLSQEAFEARGHDRVNGGHAPGLVGFVSLALGKLAARLDPQQLQRVRGLLGVLAVLPFEVPGRLFRYSAEELREAWAEAQKRQVFALLQPNL